MNYNDSSIWKPLINGKLQLYYMCKAVLFTRNRLYTMKDIFIIAFPDAHLNSMNTDMLQTLQKPILKSLKVFPKLNQESTRSHYDSYLKATFSCCKSFTPCSYASFSWLFYLSLGCPRAAQRTLTPLLQLSH